MESPTSASRRRAATRPGDTAGPGTGSAPARRGRGRARRARAAPAPRSGSREGWPLLPEERLERDPVVVGELRQVLVSDGAVDNGVGRDLEARVDGRLGPADGVRGAGGEPLRHLVDDL